MKTRLTLKAIGILGCFILLFAGKVSAQEGLKIGDMAPDFKLKNIDGKLVSLADYKDAKGYLVVFTCNTCPYAQAYEDRIIKLHAKYESQNVPVIAINPNNPTVKAGDSYEAMMDRAKDKGFKFPYLVDEGQKVYPKYGATRTPHVYLLQKTAKGNKVAYIGAIDDNYQDASQVEDRFVEDAVDAMLNGTPIKVTTTKAIGCSIKA
ncbi:thioredoxin family protein [Croceivirga radicis]|uniref:Thioredoxin family protein n=1 Tax=Croceivirga radicis TaxID=1929488 RepID=A0A1V6LND1_9FLAO|nr:thioredoxin family protein [Croceivirga radicis]OQD41662.1 thioredoxin family protein [Croceivirga radicis]